MPETLAPLVATTFEEIEIPARELVLGLVGVYNRAYWPAAIFGVVGVLGALALVLAKPGAFSDIVAKVLLDLAWVWTGVMFFLGRLAADVDVAYVFGIAFIIQGTFLVADIFYGTLEFRPGRNPAATVAILAMSAAAIFVHPMLATALGRGWPELTLAGTAPGPTAAATLCLFMFTLHKPRPLFFVIPAAWALAAGALIAQAWHFYEELILAGVALVAVLWFAYAAWRAKSESENEPVEGAAA
jgi:hypothetical protein